MEHVEAMCLVGLGALVSAGPVRLDPTDRNRVQWTVMLVRTPTRGNRLGGDLPQFEMPPLWIWNPRLILCRTSAAP